MNKPTGHEHRIACEAWPEEDFEVRTNDDGTRTFSGYAAVFNKWSEDLGGFRERIEPGAFTRTLATNGNRVRMFLNHNWDVLLATTKAGTLRLMEDHKGLLVSADLPDTTAGRDLAALLERGDVDSMSFGFQSVKDDWTSETERTLREVRLYEVSPVTAWPAYPQTSAFVRTLAEHTGEAEAALADAFRALVDPGTLSDEHKSVLLRAINARGGGLVGPRLVAAKAALRQRL